MRSLTIREKYAAVAAASLLVVSLVPISFAQLSPALPPTQTNSSVMTNRTNLANTTDFESARQQYLDAWNQTEFQSVFSTFIEPYSEQGYGVYTDHPSDIFSPGDTITLYLEPVGFSHMPVLDEQGNTLYQMNLTAKVAIEDDAGNLLATIEDLPPFELVSHRKNTELYMTVTVTQQEPFPEGAYRLTYEIGDGQTGETILLTKDIRVAQTVSS
jgi:hypothetical protein